MSRCSDTRSRAHIYNLMTAADEPVRQAGYYLPMIFGAIGTWAASKAGLLELDCEERKAHRSAHAAA